MQMNVYIAMSQIVQFVIPLSNGFASRTVFVIDIGSERVPSSCGRYSDQGELFLFGKFCH